ncbi:hypothetical protein R3P38DRAFT_2803705 [Favolaschia claudopus]|uniref:BRCT domain-containing protein n=1 Tax=Favolaschia claudopus TaxID=2862362 RepID=A0AAV9ZSE8_9AGAR
MSKPTSTIPPISTRAGCEERLSEFDAHRIQGWTAENFAQVQVRLLFQCSSSISLTQHWSALPEPKPVVVGMEWVVKSAETLVRQKELYYIIDPDNMNATKAAVDAEPRVNSTLFSFGALPPYKMAQLRKTSMNA